MKSHVTLEKKLCSVCGKEYDTGSILLDRQLRERFEMYTTTGYGLCEEDKSKFDAGFIALVVVDKDKSFSGSDGKMKMENAHRTGEIIHIKKEVLFKMFNQPVDTPMVFIEQEVADKIKGWYEKGIKK